MLDFFRVFAVGRRVPDDEVVSVVRIHERNEM